MNIVNLTPHDIALVGRDGGFVTVPASGRLARVGNPRYVVCEDAGHLFGHVDVVQYGVGEVEGLPAPEENTIYLVSRLVLDSLRDERTDVFAPDTGVESCVRDTRGTIIGVRALIRQREEGRRCQCGSGQYWAECQTGSAYCG